MKKTIKQFSLKEITISLLTTMIVLCILSGGILTAEAAVVSGTGGCVSFCGNFNDNPYHDEACCDGSWWYDACGWDSYCSTDWYNFSGYITECCEECSAVSDCPNGFECSGEKCEEEDVDLNKTPIGSISFGKTLLGDYVPRIYGYVYDPTDTNNEENVSLEVVYNNSKTATYGTGYTNKEVVNATCNSLSKKCGFAIAIDDTYLNDGNNSIKISAIDPDTNERILLYNKTIFFHTYVSCPSLTSKRIMQIGAYTFNRGNITETWKGCANYAVASHGGSIQWRQYYSVWPSGWSDIKDGSFSGSNNLGIHPHLSGGGDAYTLEIYKNNTIDNVNGKGFSGNQKCSYLQQDYVWSKDIIGDSWAAFVNPSCVALGANETSINYGESVNLAWELGGIDSAILTEVGSVSGNGSIWLTPLVTTRYVLTGKIGDIEVEESITVHVIISCNMWGIPTSINSGESTTLAWESTGAAFARIDNGIGEVSPDGSKIISPAVTTTYNATFGSFNPMRMCGERAYCSQTINVIPSLYSCTGSIPAGYEAHDIEESAGLTTNTAWTLSASDTATKCQYKISPYSCTGSIPANHEAYDTEESTDLTTSTAWTLSASDTATKCQYKTSTSNTYSCTGSIPANHEAYDTEESTDLTIDTPWVYSAIDNAAKKCEYKVSVSVVKPSCSANFDPTSITAPGSSTLTWSSQNASDIKYTCTGPITGGANYGSIPVNSPVSPAVIFDFDISKTGTESCTFTVKNNDGDEGTCITNGGTGVVVTSTPPTCTLSADKTLVLSGDPLNLTWTSTYAQSGSIDNEGGNANPVEGGTNTINPTVATTQDITYAGTFNGYGGTATCPISHAVKIVANPPAIIPNSFKVLDTKTGHNPKAEWKTENVVKCEIESDTGFSATACSSEATCAIVSNYEINKIIMEETAYTLTCYHEEPSLKTTATFTPLPKFTFSGDPLEVEIEFKGGSAITIPSVELEVTSWNGYLNDIIFTSDALTSLPESPGDETTNHLILEPNPLTFNQYYNNGINSFMEIFASYRFTGQKVVEICGNGSANCIDIIVNGKSIIPIYEPI